MGAKGTCQKLTSQRNPLPVCNLSEEPYPLDRDPGKSFLCRERVGGRASRVLSLSSPPPKMSQVPVPRSSCHLLCCPGAERLEEVVCLAGSSQVYIGYVYKPPGACSAVVAVPRPDLGPSPACPQ